LMYIRSDDTFINRVSVFLLLDREDKIVQYNPDAGKLLRRGDSALLDQPFTNLLSPASRKQWKVFRTARGTDRGSDQEIQLEFLVKERLLLTLTCNIVPFLPASNLSGLTQLAGSHIRMVDMEKQARIQRIHALGKIYAASDTLYRDHGRDPKGISLTREDRVMIRKVTVYLLNRLQEPMDSIPNLARKFGTNEHKLKHGFKKVHGETIFRYVQNKKLGEAMLLMEHTDLSVLAISDRCGFVNPSHFSMAFKKKYGASPKNYRKTFLDAVATQIKRLKNQNTPLEE
ncbi:MAG TPA: helix-turn-helix domain-containing protein, partial [Arenibacter sp.]|nr:helix-turn-helix domain-containing protein [Arenibacter sp.]